MSETLEKSILKSQDFYKKRRIFKHFTFLFIKVPSFFENLKFLSIKMSENTPIPEQNTYKIPFPIKAMMSPQDIIACLGSPIKKVARKSPIPNEKMQEMSISNESKSIRSVSSNEIKENQENIQKIEGKNGFSSKDSKKKIRTKSENTRDKKLETLEKSEKPEKTEISEKSEKSEKPEKTEKIENLEKEPKLSRKREVIEKIDECATKGKSKKNSKKSTENHLKKAVSFDEGENLITSHRIRRKLTPFVANKAREFPISEERVLRRRLFVNESGEKSEIDEKIINDIKESCKKSLEKINTRSKKKMAQK